MSQSGPLIQTGYWTDWSKNSAILGATLTYDTRWGSQLVSGATVLVQLMGAAIWTLIAFWLHQRAVTGQLFDEFEAQKQVILRNSSTTTGTILALWSLASTWHGHARKAWKRALLQMLLPLIIFAGFAVASVLVGHIAVDPFHSHALLTRGICGNINQTDTSLSAHVRFVQLLTNTSLVADAYARDCYSGSNADIVSCSSFAKPRLAYDTIRDVACPFGSGLCASNDSAAISFRASNIDSHDDLGINAKPDNRIQVGYNATCAPISQSLLSQLTKLDNTTGLQDRDRTYPTLYLRLGYDREQQTSLPFNYSTALRYYGSGSARYTVSPYRSWSPHISLNPLNTFTVGSPFNKVNADISLFVIAQNQIAYSQLSEDPVFSTYYTPEPNGYYLTDHDVAVIACTEQYQVCKQSNNCTEWSPLLPLYLDQVKNLELNEDQNATWTRQSATFVFANMEFAAQVPSPLRAADKVTTGFISIGLSDHQWMHEVEALFQNTLAQLQYLTRLYPQLPEPIIESLNLTILPPETEAGLAQCSQQRIQTPAGYTSYNLFALLLVTIIAIITIMLGFCLSTYGHNLPRRRPGQKNYPKLLAFQGDGMLQLHRMAVEAAGYGGWKSGNGHKKEVPFVEQAQKRLPPPTIFNHGTPSITSVTDSLEDGLLNYSKRESTGSSRPSKLSRARIRDSLGWIRLNNISEHDTTFQHFSLRNTPKDNDARHTVK